MPDQEINIAIAESVGWKVQFGSLRWGLFDPSNNLFDTFISPLKEEQAREAFKEEAWEIFRDSIPNYVADLNAMNEAELKLNRHHRSMFWAILHDMLFDSASVSSEALLGSCFLVMHASARQRAEAYLKTIGKWRDEA